MQEKLRIVPKWIRMDVQSILPVKVSITIGTVLNFNDDFDSYGDIIIISYRINLPQRSLSIRGLYWRGLFPIKLTAAFSLHQGLVLTGFISYQTYQCSSPSRVCTDGVYFLPNLPQRSLSIRGLYWWGLFPIKLTAAFSLHQGLVLMGLISYQSYNSVPSPSRVCTDGVYFLSNLPQCSLSIKGLYWRGLFLIKLTTAFPLHQGFVLMGFISYQTYRSALSPSGACTDGVYFLSNLPQRSLSIRACTDGVYFLSNLPVFPLHQGLVLTGFISYQTYHSVPSPSRICTDGVYFLPNLPQRSLSIRGLYWQGLFPIKLTAALSLHQGLVLMGFISYQTYRSALSPSGVCTDRVYFLSNLPQCSLSPSGFISYQTCTDWWGFHHFLSNLPQCSLSILYWWGLFLIKLTTVFPLHQGLVLTGFISYQTYPVFPLHQGFVLMGGLFTDGVYFLSNLPFSLHQRSLSIKGLYWGVYFLPNLPQRSLSIRGLYWWGLFPIKLEGLYTGFISYQTYHSVPSPSRVCTGGVYFLSNLPQRSLSIKGFPIKLTAALSLHQGLVLTGFISYQTYRSALSPSGACTDGVYFLSNLPVFPLHQGLVLTGFISYQTYHSVPSPSRICTDGVYFLPNLPQRSLSIRGLYWQGLFLIKLTTVFSLHQGLYWQGLFLIKLTAAFSLHQGFVLMGFISYQTYHSIPSPSGACTDGVYFLSNLPQRSLSIRGLYWWGLFPIKLTAALSLHQGLVLMGFISYQTYHSVPSPSRACTDGVYFLSNLPVFPLHQGFVLMGFIFYQTYRSIPSPSGVCTDGVYFLSNLPQHSLSIRGLYWWGLFLIKLTTAFPLHQGFVLTGFISHQTYHSVPSPSRVCTDGVYFLSNLPQRCLSIRGLYWLGLFPGIKSSTWWWIPELHSDHANLSSTIIESIKYILAPEVLKIRFLCSIKKFSYNEHPLKANNFLSLQPGSSHIVRKWYQWYSDSAVQNVHSVPLVMSSVTSSTGL